MQLKKLANYGFLSLGIIILMTGVFFLPTKHAHADDPTFSWAKQLDGHGSDYYYAEPYSTETDSDGNVYIGGYFEGTIDFDPGVGTFDMTAAAGDLFIVKLDSDGNFIWAKDFSGDNYNWLYDVAVGSDGSVYATGYFSGTTDFDPGVGDHSLTAHTSHRTDVFLVKLDTDGNFVWAGNIGGTANTRSTALAIDLHDNLYVTGRFESGPIDFDIGAGTQNLTPGGAFLVKYSSDGSYIWGENFGTDTFTGQGFDVATDPSGNVYLGGEYQGTVDFDYGAGTSELTNSTYTSFVLKLNKDGDFVFVKELDGQGSFDTLNNLKLDSDNNIYYTGYLFGGADFDPGPSEDVRYALDTRSAYVSKLDSDGNFIWADVYGTYNSGSVSGMAVKPDGNVYLLGRLRDTFDVDPNVDDDVSISTSDGETYLSHLDSNGNFVGVQQFGAGASYSAPDGIGLSADGELYLLGGFSDTGDFDPTSGIYNLTAFPDNDDSGVIVKLTAGGSTPSPTAPTVTSSAASNITATSADLNGNITDIGTSTPTIEGFEYGLTGGYGTSATDTGSYTTGAFLKSLSGLTCDTTYYFRALATSVDGTGNGSGLTFTTSPCPTSSSSSSSSRPTSPVSSSTCGITLSKYIQKGRKNDPEAVKKVQKFLNNFFHTKLAEDGVFGNQTDVQVRAFQLAHKDKILDPWHLKKPTGIVYITTTTEMNNISCASLKLAIPTNLIPYDSNPAVPSKI